MNKQLKLTWKYFIQQKLEEIFKPIWLVAVIICIPYILGFISYSLGFKLIDWIEMGYNYFSLWWQGASILGIILILLMIIVKIVDWLRSNWDKAKKRAIKELEGKKK